MHTTSTTIRATAGVCIMRIGRHWPHCEVGNAETGATGRAHIWKMVARSQPTAITTQNCTTSNNRQAPPRCLQRVVATHTHHIESGPRRCGNAIRSTGGVGEPQYVETLYFDGVEQIPYVGQLGSRFAHTQRRTSRAHVYGTPGGGAPSEHVWHRARRPNVRQCQAIVHAA